MRSPALSLDRVQTSEQLTYIQPMRSPALSLDGVQTSEQLTYIQP